MDHPGSSSASRSVTPRPTTTPGQRLFENAHNFSVGQIAGRDVHHHVHYAHTVEDPTPEDIAKIASWLSPINYWLYHNITASLRTPQTGMWFLHGPEFQRWLSHRTGTLWVTGMPGAGKTVLSTNVVDVLRPTASHRVAPENQPTALVFVYCRYMDHCTAGDILRTFLKQLLQSRRIVYRYLKPIFDENAPKQTQLTDWEAAETLQQIVPLFERTQAVIDGLDEVSDDEKVKFLALLERLPMQVLIFSRPMDIFMELLPNIETLSIEARNDDIELFARDRIQKTLTLRKLLHGKASLCNQITNTVKDKSRGMFLVAAMQINSLKRSMNMRALTTALDSLPTGVDDLYHLTMRRIEDQSDERSRLALHTLLWLAYAHRTLTIEELQDALATSHEAGEYDSESRTPIETILSCCCGIVVVDQPTQEVRLIHYTALEYIRKLTVTPFSRRAFIMTSTCIVYLRHFRLYDHDVSSPEGLERFLGGGPFLCYAYQFWGVHARELTTEPNDSGVRAVTLSFLRSCAELLIPFLHQATPSQYTKMALPYLLGYKMLDILCRQDRTFVSYDCLNSFHLTALYGLTPLLPVVTRQCRPSRNHLWSALHIAALHNHADVMKLLLSNDFPNLDVNAQDIHGRSALHLAAQGGNCNVVDLLLDHPIIDVNRRDAFGCVPICVAAGNGHAMVVDRLLKCLSVDVNATDKDGNNLLLIALSYYRLIDPTPLVKHPIINMSNNNRTLTHPSESFRDCHDISDYMIKAITSNDKLQPNTTHMGEVTPLLFAVLNNRLNAARSLLSHPGIDPNKCDCDGISPLMAASGCGSPAAFIFDVPEEEQNTMVLSMRGLPHPGINVEMVRLLLSHPSTDVNFRSGDGLGPLMLAAVGGREHIARALLQDPRVDVNIRSTLGRTALFWATADREAISTYLLRHPIIWPDILGTEESAARHARHAVAQQILLHSQLDPNLRCDGDEGQTALMLASRLGWGSIVRHLLLENQEAIRREAFGTGLSGLPSPVRCTPESPIERDIDWGAVRALTRCRDGLEVNAVSHRCDTALTWACREGHMGIVELLLSHPNIDVNAGNPLAAACSAYNNDNWEMVRLLIYDNTLQVNQRDPDGYTALIHACRNNRVATAELLLAHPDIDVNLSDFRGFTPLMAAVTSTAEDPSQLVALLRGHPDVDVNLRDEYGMTASHHALEGGRSVFHKQSVLGSLLAKSPHGREVDVGLRDNMGRCIREMALDIYKLNDSLVAA